MKRSGFTLIEMTIVLFIISLLILIMIPNLASQKSNAKTVHGNAMVSVIQNQVDSYTDEHDEKNVSIDELVKSKYLTWKQANEAKKENICIAKNHVYQR